MNQDEGFFGYTPSQRYERLHSVLAKAVAEGFYFDFAFIKEVAERTNRRILSDLSDSEEPCAKVDAEMLLDDVLLDNLQEVVSEALDSEEYAVSASVQERVQELLCHSLRKRFKVEFVPVNFTKEVQVQSLTKRVKLILDAKTKNPLWVEALDEEGSP
jgi:hypothetical protein